MFYSHYHPNRLQFLLTLVNSNTSLIFKHAPFPRNKSSQFKVNSSHMKSFIAYICCAIGKNNCLRPVVQPKYIYNIPMHKVTDLNIIQTYLPVDGQPRDVVVVHQTFWVDFCFVVFLNAQFVKSLSTKYIIANIQSVVLYFQICSIQQIFAGLIAEPYLVFMRTFSFLSIIACMIFVTRLQFFVRRSAIICVFRIFLYLVSFLRCICCCCFRRIRFLLDGFLHYCFVVVLYRRLFLCIF